MERGPQQPEGGEHEDETTAETIYEQLTEEQRIRPGSADAGDDDREQAIIEAARAVASRERRADRARLERYVALGLDPGDAEALIEFERLSPQQRAQWAGIDAERPSEPTVSETPTDESAATTGEPTPEQETASPPPRIYIADLAAYTSGRLHGAWLDATREVTELQAEVQAMLAASPVPEAEEYAIHDHDGFSGYPLGEHESLSFVHRLAAGIAEHGQAFAAYADWIGSDDEELERFADHYEGTYPTREAWAGELADEVFEWPRYMATIPEPLRMHVRLDLTSFALDLEQDRHVVQGDEGVYVFNPHA